MTTTAPYGSWASPITAEMLAADAIGLSECRLEDGLAYWLERRPTEGRSVVMRGDPFSSPADVTPAGFDVRSMAHEYGGGAYTVHDGTVYFVNKVDQRIYRQPDGGQPEPITPDTDGKQRFADGLITTDGRWWIGVRERHDLGPAMADVVNELVALPTDGSAEPRTIVGGRDFYATPRDLPRRFDAVVPRLGSAVDAVGRLRALRRELQRGRRGGSAGAARRPRRRGVDLAADLEPDRRPRVRERPQRLVEPRADRRRERRRRPERDPRGRGRVRLPDVDVRRAVVRVHGRRTHRLPVRPRRADARRARRPDDRAS